MAKYCVRPAPGVGPAHSLRGCSRSTRTISKGHARQSRRRTATLRDVAPTSRPGRPAHRGVALSGWLASSGMRERLRFQGSATGGAGAPGAAQATRLRHHAAAARVPGFAAPPRHARRDRSLSSDRWGSRVSAQPQAYVYPPKLCTESERQTGNEFDRARGSGRRQGFDRRSLQREPNLTEI